MGNLTDWLRDRSYYDGQIEHTTTIPSATAETTTPLLHREIEDALDEQGIESLYAHQARALSAIRDGDNVVLATPTASGKSLAYQIPALERGLSDPGRTLYIAPTQALLNDQAASFRELTRSLDTRVEVGTFHGATTDQQRTYLKRRQQPEIVLMTPDMIHQSLLPWGHSNRHWRWFLETLDTVVVDEVHAFRGVFGSHVGLVLRRLNRLATKYGTSPQFVCCSATIANPVEHAATVTGQAEGTYTLVDTDASAHGRRHWIFWNPPLDRSEHDSPDIHEVREGGPESQAAEDTPEGGARKSNHAEAVRLFCDLVTRGLQTLVFTRTRQGTERYVQWADSELRDRGHGNLADAVTSYHGELSSTRRDEVESQLRDGSLRGVWSTNALEVGIDIGSLDAVILDGHPGTSMSALQRAGRAGRGTSDSHVILVASDNPLDQYTLRDPESLFEGTESAISNPENPQILDGHLYCAADETPLGLHDTSSFGPHLPDRLEHLAETGLLQKHHPDGRPPRWEYDGEPSPQHDLVDIRDIGMQELELIDVMTQETLLTLPLLAALRDAHPDAIFHHQKQTYRVIECDYSEGRIFLRPVETNSHTRPHREKDVTVESVHDTKQLDTAVPLQVSFAELTVDIEITGYFHYDSPQDDDGVERSFDQTLPTHSITTNGFIFTVPSTATREVRMGGEDESPLLGGLHAIEHTLISLFPIEILCDRSDIGGMSTTSHPFTGKNAIVVHDGYPGGVGLTRTAYNDLQRLLSRTRDVITSCRCADGCPSCIYSPQCGNANRTLDKSAAQTILHVLLTD